jgi:hypothetical protein
MYTVTVWHRSHDQAPTRRREQTPVPATDLLPSHHPSLAEPVPTIAKRVRVQSRTLPDPHRAVTSTYSATIATSMTNHLETTTLCRRQTGSLRAEGTGQLGAGGKQAVDAKGGDALRRLFGAALSSLARTAGSASGAPRVHARGRRAGRGGIAPRPSQAPPPAA